MKVVKSYTRTFAMLVSESVDSVAARRAFWSNATDSFFCELAHRFVFMANSITPWEVHWGEGV